MAENVLRIHADELTYTPAGLTSTRPIDLKVGAHNRVVVVRPKLVPAVPVGFGGFAIDSSFPSPVALAVLLAPVYRNLFGDITGGRDSAYYQFFGHAQPEGDESKNKDLTERRAKALAALLTGDSEQLQTLADSESWGDAEAQVMLRVLRCDPGVVDGNAGNMTEAATRIFQEEYRDGVFHRHADLPADAVALLVDGVLGPATRKALVDAFVAGCSPRIPSERLHPSHPAVGCSEFNQVEDGGDRPGLNRRVALVIHETLPPFYENAPCKEGDHSACPVDDESPSRCPWYRWHVDEVTTSDLVHRHYDLRWLALPNRRILLSALTTLADDDVVTFQVFRTKPVSGPEEVYDENLGPSISAEMRGIVRLGVAQVVWDPPEGFDLLDFRAWKVPVAHTSAHEIWHAPRKTSPPIFRIAGGGATELSPAPGDDLTRLAGRREGGDEDEPQLAVGIDAFGRLFQIALANGRPTTTRNALERSETRVVAVRFVDAPTTKKVSK